MINYIIITFELHYFIFFYMTTYLLLFLQLFPFKLVNFPILVTDRLFICCLGIILV